MLPELATDADADADVDAWATCSAAFFSASAFAWAACSAAFFSASAFACAAFCCASLALVFSITLLVCDCKSSIYVKASATSLAFFTLSKRLTKFDLSVY